MLQFLVDECLTPALATVANESGYVAHHVLYRGWRGSEDADLLRHIQREDLTLVTNNWKDFAPMLWRARLHCGAVVLPNVARAGQVRAFVAALAAIRSADPPLDMVNTVVDVAEDGRVRVYPFP